MRKVSRATEGITSLVISVFLKRVMTPAPASLFELKLPWKEPDTQLGKFQPMEFVENCLLKSSILPAQPWGVVQKEKKNRGKKINPQGRNNLYIFLPSVSLGTGL